MIVSPENAQILFDALPQTVEKELIYIEGAGHNNIFQFHTEYFTPLKKFIQNYK
jgi:hypothetical protein